MATQPILLAPAIEQPLATIQTAKIAFQPIVATNSLRTHGFEALTRLDGDGYPSVHALMDCAADNGNLLHAERLLLEKSIGCFSRFDGAAATRLFCNVDNRVFDDAAADPMQVVDLARHYRLEPANLCIELSERQPPQSLSALRHIVAKFLAANVRIAIDDFGRGFSGIDMLMQVDPHYIKIDRAFISGVSCNARQQAIVSKVAGLAHSLGLLVVAEGVETAADFRIARDLGCDLAQGFLICRPTTSISDLRMSYGHIEGVRPAGWSIPALIGELMEHVEPLRLTDSLRQATDRFKTRTVKGMVPVVDEHEYVHGAIYESDIGNYLFGDYGSALLANKGMDQSVTRVLRRCPISEATVAPEAIVESYVVSASNEGIVLTVEGRYVGLLGNTAMLRLAAVRDVAAARDQNPLTSLPGNQSIQRHLLDLSDASDRHLILFDFDNFKAFNDKYGFETGDRALLIFAELLRKIPEERDAFVGHIGGDDFFLSMAGSVSQSLDIVTALCGRFHLDVSGLYSAEDRQCGGICSQDRFGETRFFPMLRASAAIVHLDGGNAGLDGSAIVSALSSAKAAAKKSESGLIEITLRSEAPPALNAPEAASRLVDAADWHEGSSAFNADSASGRLMACHHASSAVRSRRRSS